MKNRCRKRGKVTNESEDMEHEPSRMTGLMKKNSAILSKIFFNI